VGGKLITERYWSGNRYKRKDLLLQNLHHFKLHHIQKQNFKKDLSKSQEIILKVQLSITTSSIFNKLMKIGKSKKLSKRLEKNLKKKNKDLS
jgi:hypothetical protein